MRIAITGATGWIGRTLMPRLVTAGHEVVALVRDAERGEEILGDLDGVERRVYDPFDPDSVLEAIEGAEGLVNLAGENIFAQRWRKAFKKSLRDSRVLTTRALRDALRAMPLEARPKVLVSASAVGFYGPREAHQACLEDEYDAQQFAPRDFLAHVCHEWEREARRSELLGLRVVRVRIGVVLGQGEGALAALEPVFKKGGGGPVAGGKQIMSWIHIDDACRLLQFALEHGDLSGPVNATAPNPVSNKEFAKALGRALGRPAFLPTPGRALRLILGEVAEVVASGQRALPTVATAHGFRFEYPTVEEALAAIYPAKQKQVQPA